MSLYENIVSIFMKYCPQKAELFLTEIEVHKKALEFILTVQNYTIVLVISVIVCTYDFLTCHNALRKSEKTSKYTNCLKFSPFPSLYSLVSFMQ